MKKRTKFAIIGGGNIGGSLVYLIAMKNLGDVVILDVQTSQAQGKALDISQASSLLGSSVKVLGTSNYQDLEGADVVFITAGIARTPGMSRDDLLTANAAIIRYIAASIKPYAYEALVIVITNPVDIMVWLCQQVTGFAPNKVIGLSGVLDTARFRYFLAQHLEVTPLDITTLVLGGHGDTMVPLISHTSVGGVPLVNLIEQGAISAAAIERVIERTRDGGAEIVSLLKNGSAYYAPASSALAMAESYLHDHKKIMCCAALLQGEYGKENIYLGVPVVIGGNGVEQVVQLSLNAAESSAFEHSAATVQTNLRLLPEYFEQKRTS